jgi:2,4-dienoyl-CoA reductase-like NADH-dependent reductase (Old Yellow Enzyme family)/thioredoxin reductase
MSEPVESDQVATGFGRLFTPITIGSVTVRNRIVNTTHGTRLDEPRELRYLRERARGGAGLIGLQASLGVGTYSVGPTRSSPTPAWDETFPSPLSDDGIAYFDEAVIPALRRRAEVIHAEGAACYAQIYHLGGAPHAARVFPPIAPSAVPDPYDALMPHPLSSTEIDELIFAFAEGVRRVRDAGVDAVEIHGAHGYLVHQFLSPYFNRREDEWGGTAENRLRFLRAIIAAARERVGEFPIGIRLGVDGDAAGRGVTLAGLVEISHALRDDVAYLSISGGNYAGFGDGFEVAYVSPSYRAPGFNVPASTAVKAVVDVPVIVTGRVSDASIAEGILAEGGADMVGMVRALIADPELPRKARSGRADQARPCLGISECHHIGPDRTPVACGMNAGAGREAEMELVPAPHPRTIVVVGAGPAGLEAARVARLRGHRVYLCDRRREIGGAIAMLGLDANRAIFRDHAAYFRGELKRLKIEQLLGHEVTAADLLELAPDAVVVATGGKPVVPAAAIAPDGVSPHVYNALDVVSGRTVVTGPALVVGGVDAHLAGPTTAEYLADRGVPVELITEQVDFARSVEDATRLTLLRRLAVKGVRVSLHHRLIGPAGSCAIVEDTFANTRRELPGTSVVLACGLVPDDRLYRELSGRVDDLHLVGDALAPRRLVHATLDGARVGRAL